MRLVHATRGKQIRAEPIAALYEQGRVHHVGRLDALELQMTTWSPIDDRRSPDRVDALVWALSDLMLRSRAWTIAEMEAYGRDDIAEIHRLERLYRGEEAAQEAGCTRGRTPEEMREPDISVVDEETSPLRGSTGSRVHIGGGGFFPHYR